MQAPALRPDAPVAWPRPVIGRPARLAVLQRERVRRATGTASADRVNDRRARRRGYRVQDAEAATRFPAGPDHNGRADRDGSAAAEKHGLPFDRTVQRRGTHSRHVLINACGSCAIGTDATLPGMAGP